MKIAIPTAGGKLCAHFGHCEKFAIIEADKESKNMQDTQWLTPPPHEPGTFPAWVKEQGANLVIAGGMGGRAQDLFTQQGVDVIVGATEETPEAVVKAYLQGTLKSGGNACDH